MEFLQTRDGSFSLYNAQYGDFYHSQKDGAILETLYKHIIPAFGLILANPRSNSHFNQSSNRNFPIKILDICFGLGYNALFSLAYAKRLGIFAEICSVELHLLTNLREFCYPRILRNTLNLDEILSAIYENGEWQGDFGALYLHKGDCKAYLADLTRESFDIIYQDAFSPSKNPTLWDEAHFKNLYALLKKNGVITTYSSAKKVRQITQNVGFEVYNMQCGNLKNGTILRKNSRESYTTQSQNATQSTKQSAKIECIALEILQI